MYTTTTLISLFSYIGTIASVVGGTLTAKKMGLHWFLQLLLGVSTAFFGEVFLRDLILLRTTPAVFNDPLEIAITVAVCILSIMVLKYKKPGNICLSILCLLDSIGIVGSATIGYNQGTKAGFLIAFSCGFVTACGGNILATIIQIIEEKNLMSFFKILAGKKWCYLITASILVVYDILNFTNHNTDTAIIMLTVVSIVIGYIVKKKQCENKQNTSTFLADISR